jgi:hypothetical protein
MIDLRKALENPGEEKKIRLLSSRALIETLLDRPDINLPACIEVGTAIVKQLVAGPTLETVGWLNLFAELCRLRRHQQDCECLTATADAGIDKAICRLLHVLVSASDPDPARLLSALTSPGADAADIESGWRRSIEHWDSTLKSLARVKTREGHDRTRATPFSDRLTQLVLMHVLEAVLRRYEMTTSARERGAMNLLLVPALRRVFGHPDAAHTSFIKYFTGFDVADKCPRAFYALYDGDLGVLEDFQSRGTVKRAELLDVVRRAAQQRQGQREVAEEANWILHGENPKHDDGPIESPYPKMTRLSQLTCLIREMKEQAGSNRAFVSRFNEISYRRADVITGSPRSFEWSRVDADRKRDFLAAVSRRYAQGYEGKLLKHLFGDQKSLPLWVQDGEISFLWLLTALRWSPAPLDWIDDRTTEPLIRPLDDADPEGTQMLDFGTTLTNFATRIACLFDDGNGAAAPKAWALLNFLERAIVSCRPSPFAGEAALLRPHAMALFEEFVAADNLELETFRRGCRRLVQQGLPTREEIKWNSSLPTYPLELILRKGEKVPLTLFFYPITFESNEDHAEADGGAAPGAFLAGTFAGLEWSAYPSATSRQNNHLFTALDALRPIIDHELGRAMSSDLVQFRQNIERQQDKESQLRTFEKIRPALGQLAEIFQGAQQPLAEIRDSLDPDWSGLLTRDSGLFAHVQQLFTTNREIIIKNARKHQGELEKFVVAHESRNNTHAAAETLYQRLRSLAVLGDDDGPLGTKTGWLESTDSTRLGKAFDHQPFLKALAIASLDPDVDTVCLNLILKLLTVDSTDVGRGVHPVQIAAILGMFASTTRSGGPERVRILFGEDAVADREYGGGSFSPTRQKGIKELCLLLEGAEGIRAQREVEPNRTVRISAGVPLHGEMEPAKFLRALINLCSEVLRGDERVNLDDWHIDVRERGLIRVELVCNNQFTAVTRQQLGLHMSSQDKAYHNLRSNMRDLAIGIGSPPSYVPSDTADIEPDENHRFLIFENGAGKKRSIWRFLLGSPARNRRSGDAPLTQ